jgi:hypothetical protein
MVKSRTIALRGRTFQTGRETGAEKDSQESKGLKKPGKEDSSSSAQSLFNLQGPIPGRMGA